MYYFQSRTSLFVLSWNTLFEMSVTFSKQKKNTHIQEVPSIQCTLCDSCFLYGILTVDRSYFGIQAQKKVVKASSWRHLNCLMVFLWEKKESLIFCEADIRMKSLNGERCLGKYCFWYDKIQLKFHCIVHRDFDDLKKHESNADGLSSKRKLLKSAAHSLFMVLLWVKLLESIRVNKTI